MALVNITNVMVMDNPAPFTNPFSFEITFECIQELQDDLEWKVIYVGSTDSYDGDQVLEEVMVGPVPVGVNRFVLQSAAPDPRRIRNEDLIGVTVLLITCSYRDRKFVQIGYYVNNEYAEPFETPEQYHLVDVSKLFRNVLADQPRVTRYAIDWLGTDAPPIDADAQQEGEEVPVLENDDDDALGRLDQMEEDEDEEEEEEDDDNGEEVDLEAEDEEAEGEGDGEDDEEGDEEEEEEGEGEGEDEEEEKDEGERQGENVAQSSEYVYQEYYDENNTMDIERMIQQ